MKLALTNATGYAKMNPVVVISGTERSDMAKLLFCGGLVDTSELHRYRANTIGRHSSSDLVLSNVCVSRQHAKIEYDKEHNVWSIYDCGSTNGTFVNGVRLEPGDYIVNGDVICIGKVIEFTFQE